MPPSPRIEAHAAGIENGPGYVGCTPPLGHGAPWHNGRPAAVLLAYDDLAALEETLDVLSDPAALADIRDADADVLRGDVEHLVTVVRVEHRADAYRRR